MFIDSHAHLRGETQEVEELLQRAEKAGISSIVNICCSDSDLDQGLSLINRDGVPKIYLAAAKTPHDPNQEDTYFSKVEKQAKEKMLVAIGETGLDYFYKHTDKKVQEVRLRSYLQLSKEHKLPVIIHCREAFSDFFDIYHNENTESKSLRGVIHCFDGTKEDAKRGLDLGLYISFTGMVTYPKNRELRETLSYVPADRMLIETDSPYLPPQPYRGKKNEPAYLVETAKFIADLKKIPIEDFANITSSNAKTLFNLGV